MLKNFFNKKFLLNKLITIAQSRTVKIKLANDKTYPSIELKPTSVLLLKIFNSNP